MLLFALSLPSTDEVFGWVEGLPSEVGRMYWKRVSAYQLRIGGGVPAVVVSKLIDAERPYAALEFLRVLDKDRDDHDAELIASTLEACSRLLGRDTTAHAEVLYPQHHVSAGIDQIQRSTVIAPERIASIEWAFVVWADYEVTRFTPYELIKQICREPSRFVELIRLKYKRRVEAEDFDYQDSSRANALIGLLNQVPSGGGYSSSTEDILGWVAEVRRLATIEGLLPWCDSCLGALFARVWLNSPSGHNTDLARAIDSNCEGDFREGFARTLAATCFANFLDVDEERQLCSDFSERATEDASAFAATHPSLSGALRWAIQLAQSKIVSRDGQDRV